MAQWNENPSWTPFEQINGGNRFERRLSAEDLNTLAENIAYLKSIGVTGDATAKEFTVVEGLTYYANNKKHTGTMRHFRNIGYTNLSLKPNTNPTAPTGYFDIYARSGEYFYVPPTLSFENLGGEAIASIQEPNLISTNIKKGINIFGLTGSYEGSTIGQWQGGKVYNPDDIAIDNGIYYICIKTTQGGWQTPENTPTEWKRLNGSYKGAYDEVESYSIGDIVESNGNIYQANRDNPISPPYNDMGAHWDLLYESKAVIVDVETCTMEYVSGSDPLGIVYSDGTESTTWANTPTGERITVACNTPITFYYPMSDDEPNVTLTTENGVTIQPFFSLNYKTLYSIPSEYKNTRITITW